MSDELVNTLENLGLFFGGATGRLTRDYGELSGDNFQMMTMHADPEKLAKDLASLADAAARIRLLEQQLSTAREALEWYGEQTRLCRLIHSGGDPGRHALSADGGNRAAAAIRSLGEKE